MCNIWVNPHRTYPISSPAAENNTSMDNDAITAILLHLPIKPLLRFRTVGRFWRDIIDSPSFTKSHAREHAERDGDDDKVLLLFTFVRDRISEISMMFLDNGKSFNDFPAFEKFFNNDLMPACFLNDYGREKTEYGRFIRVVGPVNGLICIHHRQSNGPIAVCNPSVGKIYVLPESPTCSFYKYPKIVCRDVGISYDNVVPDYKVVQLLSCRGHRRLHASIYSRTTNCWRELLARDAVLDQDVYVQKPIRSSCQNGSISHWQAVRAVGEDCDHVILSFDAKNEVFRTLEMPDYGILKSFERVRVFAKGGDSFAKMTEVVDDI